MVNNNNIKSYLLQKQGVNCYRVNYDGKSNKYISIDNVLSQSSQKLKINTLNIGKISGQDVQMMESRYKIKLCLRK